MFDCGTLKIGIKVDEKGAAQSLSKLKDEVGKSATSFNKFSTVGTKLQSIGASCQKIGKSLTNHITKPALIAASAMAAIVLKKGWDRLKSIDDARAKLEGLGHTAKEIDSIMTSALESVKGTSFGLDEAATVAATAVAAGVKQGKALTKYLTTIANVAAISGSTMEEIGPIFNKVMANGKLTMQEVNQLADRGVPVLSALAKQSNVTEAEMRQMISSGKITAEDLIKALDYGGAAVIMGCKSMTGAIANVWASIGRIGANFLDAGGTGKGFFTAMKPLLAMLSEQLAVIEEQAAKIGTVFGTTFNMIFTYLSKGVIGMTVWNEETEKFETTTEGIGKSAQKAFTALQPLLDRMKALGQLIAEHPKEAGIIAGLIVALGPVLSIIGKLMSGLGGAISMFGTLSSAATAMGTTLGAIAAPIAGIVALIAGIVAVLVVAYAKSEQFRNAVQGLFATFKSMFSSLLSIIKPVFDTVIQVIAQVATACAPLVDAIGTALQQAFNALKPVLSAVASALQVILPIIGKVIVFIVKLVAGILNFLNKIGAFKVAITAITLPFKLLIAVISAVVNVIKSFVSFWAGLVIKQKDFLINCNANIVQPAIEKVKGAWDKVKSGTKSLLTKVSNGAKGIIDGIKGAWDKIKTANKNLSVAVLGGAKKVLDGIKSAWDKIKDGAKKTLNVVTKSTTSGNKKHRIGLREVPYDGYSAELHRGEAVLTAAEVNQYRKYLNGMDKPQTGGVSADEIVRALSKANMTVVTQVDGRTLAQTTAPFMSEEINRIDYRANRKLGYV